MQQKDRDELRLIGAHLFVFAAALVVYMGAWDAAKAILRNPVSWPWYVAGYGLGTAIVLGTWPLLAAPGLGIMVYNSSPDAGGAILGILVFLLLEWAAVSYSRTPRFVWCLVHPGVIAVLLAASVGTAAGAIKLGRMLGYPMAASVNTGLLAGALVGALVLVVAPHVVWRRPPTAPAVQPAPSAIAPGAIQAVQPAANARPGNPRAFDSLVGVDEAVEAIKDALELPLHHPKDMALYGLKPGKGLLLWGPPGTGKTSIAKATAEYFGCPFYVVNASELAGPLVGTGEQALKRVFQAARTNRPSVIFFDEIDAIGRKRDGQHLNRPADLLLNLLLAEMDGFAPNEGVFVIAATNRPDVLDAALLRPGRFDRMIEIPLPDQAAREKLFRLYLSGKPLGEIDYAGLARRSERMSPAEISALCSGAALKALKRKISGGPGEITMSDLSPG